MKHLTLLILLALAPLSWGEDVYYCVEELVYEITKDDSSGSFKSKPYLPERFTLKYSADSNQLVFKGTLYPGGGQVLACRYCNPSDPMFDAVSTAYMFSMSKDRFFLTSSTYSSAGMKTGTCTKF